MIKTKINDYDLVFETNNSLFSPNEIDKGTLDMLKKVSFENQKKVLDLGCGYGVVGILAAKHVGQENVVMCDISKDAVLVSMINAKLNKVDGVRIYESDGLQSIPDDDFTLILSNPPYHENFSIPKKFIEEGYKKLAINGTMIMVTKRKLWYKKKFISTFGGVKIFESENGYYIFLANKIKFSNTNIKKQKDPKGKLSKKLERKTKKG